MKIIQLTAENVKRLKVVDITPKSDVIEITGKNESGKTSVLDSIWWAIAGERVIQAEPIRQGEEEARIRLDLGELIVIRKFTRAGTRAIVLNPVGAEPGTPDKRLPKSDWGTPQEILKSLMGSLAFDPLAFSRKSAHEQLEELKRIVPLDVDVDALDQQNKAAFVLRTDANRKAKELSAAADAFQFSGPPRESVDVSALMAEMEAATKANARAQQLEWALSKCGQDTEALRKLAEDAAQGMAGEIDAVNATMELEIAKLHQFAEANITQIRQRAATVKAKAAEAEKHLAGLEKPAPLVDLSEFRGKIESAQAINRDNERRAERSAILAKQKAAEAEAEALTAAMEKRTKQKEAAIKAAPMPIPGIGFGPGFVTYNGVPFEQASDAVRLRVSTAIAMAGNPKLKVIRIRDGSLLDDNGRKLLAELAHEKGYQVWVERVDSTGKIGVVMEDGEVAGDYQP